MEQTAAQAEQQELRFRKTVGATLQAHRGKLSVAGILGILTTAGWMYREPERQAWVQTGQDFLEARGLDPVTHYIEAFTLTVLPDTTDPAVHQFRQETVDCTDNGDFSVARLNGPRLYTFQVFSCPDRGVYVLEHIDQGGVSRIHREDGQDTSFPFDETWKLTTTRFLYRDFGP
ncbi:MAG: hypothetical protein M3O22_03545 [Pseudomonadota bacterium]|nr:hypothetical protein [Pseudomonadota bacterium]